MYILNTLCNFKCCIFVLFWFVLLLYFCNSCGCCTLVVDKEIPPEHVERFEFLEKAEKRYINVMDYCICVNLSLP